MDGELGCYPNWHKLVSKHKAAAALAALQAEQRADGRGG
eukprot:CAMPEP_0185433804 /NCGR_PEP_ID=MMETSP1365-20130426/22224_1 /TAXON_ID=38817 /ORGANISM="Gephyrocapsa oceanica, Strain RCC1303" /LENGTH=38 /DNA_ID= /DNA_START= /DNA_END= /DNA_ORIENTATION=